MIWNMPIYVHPGTTLFEELDVTVKSKFEFL